jgi:putative protease
MAAVPVVKREPNNVAPEVPLLAVLVNKEQDLNMRRRKGTILLWEIPVTAGDESDYYAGLFGNHPDVVPWFPAILIGDHFSSALELLSRIRPKMIITDNSGIGIEARKAGIPWIAGPMLNCTNSFSMVCLQCHAGCSGAFVSHELSRDQMAAVNAPNGFSVWYTLYAPLLLMNTRQCIVRNCAECWKEHVDRQCLSMCEKSAVLHDEKGNPFHVVKRRGFYNQVYNGRNYFNPAVLRDVSGEKVHFLLDMREIPAQTVLQTSREQFVGRVETCLYDRSITAGSLKGEVKMATAGQYSRGI